MWPSVRLGFGADDRDLLEPDCGIGTWSYDFSGGHLTWSEGLFRLFGLDPFSVDPDMALFFSLIHPDDRVLVERRWADIYQHDGSAIEFRIVQPSGAMRRIRSFMRVLFDGWTPRRVIGLNIDITEFNQLRSAAAEANRHYAELLRGLSSILWSVLPDGRVVSCESLCALTGMSANDAAGWGWLTGIHEQNRAALSTAWTNLVRSGQSFSMDVLICAENGHRMPYSFEASPITQLRGEQRVTTHVCVVLQSLEPAFAPEPDKAPEAEMQRKGGTGEIHLTGALIRASRGLLDWPAKTLAHRSEVSLSTIRRMEAEGEKAHRGATARMIKSTLEDAGVEFLRMADGAIGLRLKQKK